MSQWNWDNGSWMPDNSSWLIVLGMIIGVLLDFVYRFSSKEVARGRSLDQCSCTAFLQRLVLIHHWWVPRRLLWTQYCSLAGSRFVGIRLRLGSVRGARRVSPMLVAIAGVLLRTRSCEGCIASFSHFAWGRGICELSVETLHAVPRLHGVFLEWIWRFFAKRTWK